MVNEDYLTGCSPQPAGKILSRLRSLRAQQLQSRKTTTKTGIEKESKVVTSIKHLPTSESDQRQSACDSPGKIMVLGPIQRLPDELMLLIMDHMSDPSIVALSHTCSRLYRIATRVVEDIFDRIHYPSESQSRLADQFELKGLLADENNNNEKKKREERMSNPAARKPQQQYNCVKCNNQYGATFFSLAALRGLAETRQCVVHEIRLWICPFRIWSYTKAEKLCYGAGCHPHSLPPKQAAVCGLCRCRQHFLLLHDNAVIQAIPILLFVGSNFKSMASRIETTRPQISTRLCPHMTMGDPKVWNRYSSHCERKFSGSADTCNCNMCKSKEDEGNRQCSQCLTSFQLRVRRFDGPEKVLVVYLLTRKVLSNASDDQTGNDIQTWVNHSSFPSEFKGLKEEWHWTFSGDDGSVYKDERRILEDSPFADGFCW